MRCLFSQMFSTSDTITLDLRRCKHKLRKSRRFVKHHKSRGLYMDKMLERILEIIPEKHGSKKELADAIGIPANLITDWKAGRAKSYPKYAPQIAGYYGVSLDWLSGMSDEKEYKKSPANVSIDEARKSADEIMSGLTPDEVELVRAYAQGIKARRKLP